MSFLCASCSHVASLPFGRCASCGASGTARTSSLEPSGRALSARARPRDKKGPCSCDAYPYGHAPGVGRCRKGGLSRYDDDPLSRYVDRVSRDAQRVSTFAEEGPDAHAFDPREDTVNVSPDLGLPVSVATETLAVLAKRGSGKTNFDCVLTEELLRLGQQAVVIDPVGATWGLSRSADDSGPGVLPLVGGDHGATLPEPKSLALEVAHSRLSVAVDLSHLRRDDQVGWFTLFARELFFLKSPDEFRTPCHVVVEETDVFAPQKYSELQRWSLDALEEWVRRGRSRGLGVTLSTQRASVLHKNVLTQVEMLVLLRMTSPQDREAVKEWVLRTGDEDRAYELLDSLPTLERGEAFLWAPGWLGLFRRARIRHRGTYDSSRTPEARAVVAAPSSSSGPPSGEDGYHGSAPIPPPDESAGGTLQR